MSANSIVCVAHRGASAQFPESTMLAFSKAIEQGVDALEIDVHPTADNELVVIHDANLERTTNDSGLVYTQNLREIRQLDAGCGEKVPHLEASDFLDQAIITSFSPRALLWVKSLNNEVSTMLDASPQDGSLTPRQICAQTLQAGANCLSYDFRFLTPDIVRECWLTGLALWPWDPDEQAEIEQLLRLGVQGVITNRPDVLNKVLHDTEL